MMQSTGTIEKYYVALRPQTNEMHPVHREGCPFMPEENKRIYLGLFESGNEAGAEGKKYFCNSDGCRFCSKESAEHSISNGNKINMNNQLLSFMN